MVKISQYLKNTAIVDHRSPTDRVVERLRDHGFVPRRQASGGWKCCCPAHDDHDPSLSIDTGIDGKCILHCFAGCEPEAIAESIGLSMVDLFASDTRGIATPRTPKTKAMAQPARIDPPMKATPDKPERLPLESAHDLIERGLRVIPVPFASKAPALAGWPDLRLGLADLPRVFNGKPMNIGVLVGEPSDWLVDIDIDDPRALVLADRFLPATGMVWGRAGNPRSHRIYRLTAPADTRKWKDDAGKMLVELRSSGCQTIAPGSIHPSGEAVRWDADGDPTEIDPDALIAAIEELVVALATPAVDDEPEAASAEPVPEFHPDQAFPPECEHLARYCADLSEAVQTPPAMAAALSLSIISATVCNVARIQGHGGYHEPAPIWSLVLADPASRKSSILNTLQSPILKWEMHCAKELKPEILKAEQARRIMQKRLDDLETKAAKADVEANRRQYAFEAAVLAKEIEENPIPMVPVLVASEPTPDALAQQMAQNNGRALLASAEGDAIDIIMGRFSKSKNYGVLLKGHAGDPYRAARVSRPGDIISRPALALALCIQPAAVTELWSDPKAAGVGLLARFAVVAPEDLIGRRKVRPEPLSDMSKAIWHDMITTLLRFEATDEGDLYTIQLSKDADKVLHEFQLETENELGFGDLADRRAWGGKLVGLALRVALSLHAASTWGRDGTPGKSGRVSASIMTAAVWWARYFAQCERHARGRITPATDEQAPAGKGPALGGLEAWIRDRGGVVTVRELAKSGPRAWRGSAKTTAALDQLEADGLGSYGWSEPGPTGGQPSKVFKLAQ